MAHQQEELPDPELVGHVIHGFYTHQQLSNSVTWAYEEKRYLLAEEVVAIKLNPQNFWWNVPVDGPIRDMRINRDSYFAVLDPAQVQAMRQALNLNNADDEDEEEVEEYVQEGDNKWYNYTEGQWSEEKWCSICKNLKANRFQDDQGLVTLRWKEVKGSQWLRRRWFLPDDFEQVTGIPAPNPEPVILQWQRVDGTKNGRGAHVIEVETDPHTVLYPERARPPGVLPARPGLNDPVGPGGYRRSPRGINLNLPVGAGRYWGPGRGRGGRGGGGVQAAVEE